MKKILTPLFLVLVVLTACGKGKKAEPPKKAGPFGIVRSSWTAETTPQDRVNRALEVRNVDIALTGSEKATIETNKGTIVAELYSKDAPLTVRNFIRLAECGFYDNLIWHRYVSDFVIQGGDPLGRGTGNSGYNIQFEKNPRKHEEGVLAMARGSDYNSASCQFYISLKALPNLDGEYVVFGKVHEGMDVVKQLRAQDTIRSIHISK